MLKVNKLDIATLLLRIAAGWIFIYAGYLKLFVFPRAELASYFAASGFPFPEYIGLAIGFLEFFGGIFLVTGFLVRPLGFIFAVEMLIATVVVHLPDGYSASLEVATLMFFITLSLGIMGGGKFAIDQLIQLRKFPISNS